MSRWKSSEQCNDSVYIHNINWIKWWMNVGYSLQIYSLLTNRRSVSVAFLGPERLNNCVFNQFIQRQVIKRRRITFITTPLSLDCQLETQYSRIDMHTHAGNTLHNHVTSTFVLVSFDIRVDWCMPSRSWHNVPSLVLIAQVVLLLERGHKVTTCRRSPSYASTIVQFTFSEIKSVGKIT